MSWNLLWRNGAGIGDLGRLVETHRPDLVLMQEATLPADALTRQLGGFCVRKAMSGRLHGLAVWSPRHFTTSVESLPVASKFDLPVPLFRLIAARHASSSVLTGFNSARCIWIMDRSPTAVSFAIFSVLTTSFMR